MADLLQIVDFPYVGSRDRLIFDLADVQHYAYAQGSLKPTAGAKTQAFSSGDSRWGGAHQVDEKVANGSLAWTVHVRGTSADDVAAQMEAYLQQLDARARGRWIKWRPGGAGGSGVSRPGFSPVRGSATYAPDYDSLKLQSGWALDVQVTVPVAPLIEWDCCDVEDRLDQDSFALGDWSTLSGAGAFTVDVAKRTATPAFTGRSVMAHVGRGYTFSEWETTVPFVWRGPAASTEVAALCKIIDANNYLGARVDGTSLAVWARVAGVAADIGTTVAVPLTAGKAYWLRVRLSGQTVTADISDRDTDDPWGFWTATKTVTLSAAQWAAFRPAGRAGFTVTSGATATQPQIRSGLRARPFVFASADLPQHLVTADDIPGYADARTEIVLSAVGGTAMPTFGLLAQLGRRPRNLIRTGNFVDGDITGWSGAAVTGRHAAIPGLLNIGGAGAVPEDSSKMSWSTPGTVTREGIHCTIPHSLQAGRAYTAHLFLAPDGASPISLDVLLTPASTSATLAATASVNAMPVGQWTEVTVEMIADADYPDGAMLTVRTQSATALNAALSNVAFFDAPAAEVGELTRRQAVGYGGCAPGHVRANNNSRSAVTGWSPRTVSAFAAHGEVLADVAPSAATSYKAEWMLDPDAFASDEFADQVTLAVWIRWLLDPALVAPRAQLWTEPESTYLMTGPLAAKRRYSTTGSVGRRLDIQPLGGAQRALWKPHGTVTIPTDPDTGRVRLVLAAQLGAGTAGTLFGVSDLFLVPISRMQSTPTATPNDASYPRVTGFRPFSKRFSSDGRGYLTISVSAGPAIIPAGVDTGIGGSAIALPAGARGEISVIVADNVPDDPSPATVSDSYTIPTDVRAIVTPRSRLMRG